jgi:hypothetical protein
MAVICSLSPVGYSQADQKDYRAIALELAEMAYPEEAMVATAIGGVKLAVEGAFERDPITRPYGAVLGKAILEASEAVIRDPETMKRFRDMQADIFMETYTESELREIMNFYRTPIGKKTIQSLPEVTRKGMERGMAIGRSLADSPKFREMLKDKIERLIADGKLPKTP